MWHIYRNKQGKHEFAFIKRGKYIVGSKQGYERKKTLVKSLVSVIFDENVKTVNQFEDKPPKVVSVYCYVQDDTLGIVLKLGNDGKHEPTNRKPVKAYNP